MKQNNMIQMRKMGRILTGGTWTLNVLVCLFLPVHAQTHTASDSLLGVATLPNCIRYALSHQPSVEKSLVDEEITERSISGKLAD